MFATPVIWPFSRLPLKVQAIYSLFNPLGPVIDNLRRTILFGQSPTWGLLAIGFAGALLYLMAGYTIFKRLEAELADIA
jgi:ABC-type polysaccharide/polyol phosphate export permease